MPDPMLAAQVEQLMLKIGDKLLLGPNLMKSMRPLLTTFATTCRAEGIASLRCPGCASNVAFCSDCRAGIRAEGFKKGIEMAAQIAERYCVTTANSATVIAADIRSTLTRTAG